MNQQEPKKNKTQKLSEVLAELKAEYLQSLPVKIAKLEKLLAEEAWSDLTEEFHKLKGTGKTYGFPEISILCEKLEVLSSSKETQKTVLFEQALLLFHKMRASYNKGETFDLERDPISRSIFAAKKGLG